MELNSVPSFVLHRRITKFVVDMVDLSQVMCNCWG